ncbi:hypothetical protein PHSC3_001905 [Chlamydiales bacterium STE3]|nr:hypothetical protein PHSC3_001905 [Chlamydiales bacterium STE3]
MFFRLLTIFLLSFLNLYAKNDPYEKLSRFYEEFLIFENPNQWDPLTYALETHNLEIFYLLLKEEQPAIWRYKSLIQEADVYETTPFHTAIRFQDPELLSFMLDNIQVSKLKEIFETNANSNRSNESVSILGLALYPQYCDPAIMEPICRYLTLRNWQFHYRYTGANLKYEAYILYGKMTPIQQALFLYREDVANVLIQYGFEMSQDTLHECIKLGWDEGIDYHIDRGIKLCSQCPSLALQYGHIKIYYKLLNIFAKQNSQ